MIEARLVTAKSPIIHILVTSSEVVTEKVALSDGLACVHHGLNQDLLTDQATKSRAEHYCPQLVDEYVRQGAEPPALNVSLTEEYAACSDVLQGVSCCSQGAIGLYAAPTCCAMSLDDSTSTLSLEGDAGGRQGTCRHRAANLVTKFPGFVVLSRIGVRWQCEESRLSNCH